MSEKKILFLPILVLYSNLTFGRGGSSGSSDAFTSMLGVILVIGVAFTLLAIIGSYFRFSKDLFSAENVIGGLLLIGVVSLFIAFIGEILNGSLGIGTVFFLIFVAFYFYVKEDEKKNYKNTVYKQEMPAIVEKK